MFELTHIHMESRSVQCNYCRQRIYVKSTRGSSRIICPVCKRETSETAIIQRLSDSTSSTNERRSRRGQTKVTCEKITSSFNNFIKRRPYHNSSPTLSSSSSSSLSSGGSLCGYGGPQMSASIKPSLFPNYKSLSLSSRPNKRAVLCGVSYKKGKYKLKGTINDVKNMRDLLVITFGFPIDGILVLTEEETNPENIPTRKNIQKALHWLVEGCKSGDSLVFYFSGHGLRQPDFNDDEVDGFDETICPVDFLQEGMILDNDINSIIVRPLIKGVTLHAIVDACHSGTILDLIYVYNRHSNKWDDHTPKSGARKCTSGGLAISLTACEDNQMASDTSAFTRKTMNGALTYSLIEAAKNHQGLTYGDLLDSMYEAIEEVNKTGCFVERKILKKLFNGIITQRPQLSSSEKFDVYKKHFLL